VRDLKREVEQLASRDRAVIHSLSKRLPFEHLGHDERHARVGADVVHGEDIGMIHRRGGVRFLLESMEAISIGRERGGQDLYGDVTPEP
jgi:hypothetical protein